MPSRPDRHLAGTGLLVLLGALPAQTPAAAADFRSADGSRFLLLPGEGPAVVHWVVATPAGSSDNPPGMGSLAVACAMASLRGTWTTGSRNPAAEQAALAALDAALAAHHAMRGGSAPLREQAMENLQRARAAAAAVADPLAFRRVLAGAPAVDALVRTEPGCTLFSCTTTVAGVERVARLLVERREQCALRGLDLEYAALQDAAIARWDADPLAPLRAEALALAFAGHPLAHAGDRPSSAPPDRAQALATWQRTQLPGRSVHVLTGNFDPAALRALLEPVFAATDLRGAAAAAPPLPPLQAARRSTVPGGGGAACVIGWRLDGSEGVGALDAAARWLGQGGSGWLRQQLQQRGRDGAEVHCRSRWPDPVGPGLFLVEVRHAGPAAGLADLVLAICGEAARARVDAGLVDHLHAEALRQLQERMRRPPAAARYLAMTALLQPDAPMPPPVPAPTSAEAVAGLLGSLLLQAPPVIVERGSP